ncbi:MAG: alpha/beta hydrolase [Xanthobacteraceae bacterium]
MNYAAVTVSVPQTHAVGKIEWPSTPPGDSRTDFVVRQAAYLDGEKEFTQALNAQLAARPRGSRKVLLFVHGYNTLFAEGLYRFAQVAHDSQSVAVPVFFSWASRGKLGAYVFDNNSATTARDELERVIRLLLESDTEQINILAHSMGNWVTVEAFRQIKIAGWPRNVDKIGSIFLADADVDIDVFKSQLRRFGRLRKPFYVVVSRDDRALQFSSFIAGGRSRVGGDGDFEELTALGATVIDLTNVRTDDQSNHSKFAQLSSVAPQLGAVLARGISASPEQPEQPAEQDAFGAPIKVFVDQ